MSINLAAIFGPETAVAPSDQATVSVPLAAVETDTEVEIVAPHIDLEPVPFDPFDRPDPNLRGLCQPPIHPRDPDRFKRVLTTCDRCGSIDFDDIPIHDGQSTRRDCVKCHQTLRFPKWYGRTTDEAARLERVERLLSGKLGRAVRPASELAFDYGRATKAATTGRPRP